MSLDLLTARLSKSGARRAKLPAASREAVAAESNRSTRAALDYAERMQSERYALTVSRMQSLMTERSYVAEELTRHRDRGCWTACDKCNDMRARAEVVSRELAEVFAQPVMPEDMRPGGRFARRVRHLMTTHASRIANGDTLMGSETADDIVMRAVVAAYTHDPRTPDQVVTAYRADSAPASATLVEWRGMAVPTLGALYGFTRREYFRAISEAKRERRTSSLDAMLDSDTRPAIVSREHSLTSVDPASLDWDAISRPIGPLAGWEVGNDGYTVKALLTPAPRWSVAPSAEDMALAERLNRREHKNAARAERRHAEAVREERVSLASMTATLRAATERDEHALGVDAAAIAAIASGEHTIDDVAAFLGIAPATLVRRLSSIRVSKSAIRRIASDGRPAPRQAPARDDMKVTVTVVKDTRALAAARKR